MKNLLRVGILICAVMIFGPMITGDGEGASIVTSNPVIQVPGLIFAIIIYVIYRRERYDQF